MAGKKIKEIIAAGKTAEAIRALSGHYKGTSEEQELIMLEGNFSRLLREKNLISRENYNIELNRINKTLIDLAAKASGADDQLTDHVHLAQKYRCDRVAQIQSFEKAYLLNCDSAPLQFYVIHGHKSQSPRGLCQRLHTFEIPRFVMEINPLETIEFVPDEDVIYLRKLIVSELNRLFFPGSPRKIDIANCHINDYTVSPVFQRYQGIVISIKLEEDYWRSCVPEFLNWFICEFCAAARYSAETKLLFIIQINYNEPESRTSFWPFSKKKPGADLTAALRTIEKLNILPKLGPVRLEDIYHWFDIVDITNFEDQKHVYQKYFGQVKELSMAETEKRLEQIIRDWNHF